MKKTGIALILCMCMLIGCIPAFAVTAKRSDAQVVVDGKPADLQGYNIGGANYFKLRDLAMALSETAKGFDISWDAETHTITLIPQTRYTPVGGEMSGNTETEREARPSTHRVVLNGELQKFDAYNIGGENYFKLRDILGALTITVDWDAEERMIFIQTTEYTEPAVAKELVSIICSDDEDHLCGEGLGVVVSEDGKILTNYNIMKRAYKAYAIYSKDGKQYEITGFIAYDAKKNLALVQSTIVSDSPVKLAQEEIEIQDVGSVLRLDEDNERRWSDISYQRWREDEFVEGWQTDLLPFLATSGAPAFNGKYELVGIIFPRYYPHTAQGMVAPVYDIQQWLAKSDVTDFKTFRKQTYPLSGTKDLNDVVSIVGARHYTMTWKGETIKISKITLQEDPDHYKRLHYQIYIDDVQTGTRMIEEWCRQNLEELRSSLENYAKKVIATTTNYYMDYEVSGEIFIQAASREDPGEDEWITDVTVNENGQYVFRCNLFGFEFTDQVGFFGGFFYDWS